MSENTIRVCNNTTSDVAVTIYYPDEIHLDSFELKGGGWNSFDCHYCDVGSIYKVRAEESGESGFSQSTETFNVLVPKQVLFLETDEYGMKFEDRTNTLRIYNDTNETLWLSVYYGKGFDTKSNIDSGKIGAHSHVDKSGVKYGEGISYRLEIICLDGGTSKAVIHDSFTPTSQYRITREGGQLAWKVIKREM